MKKFIKNTANSIRTKAIRLAATRRSGEGYIDTAVKILIAVVLLSNLPDVVLDGRQLWLKSCQAVVLQME